MYMERDRKNRQTSIEEQKKKISCSPVLLHMLLFSVLFFRSETLQQLVKLGVDLSRWDSQKGVSTFILPLDFEEDMKQYIV